MEILGIAVSLRKASINKAALRAAHSSSPRTPAIPSCS